MNPQNFGSLSEQLVKNVAEVDLLKPMKEKIEKFFQEAKSFISAVETGDLEKVDAVVKSFEILFTGSVGLRHMDFIAYKE